MRGGEWFLVGWLSGGFVGAIAATLAIVIASDEDDA